MPEPAFTVDDFSTPLWNPLRVAEAQPKKESEAARPEPIKLELVSIIDEAGELRGVYDPQKDRLVIVAAGAEIDGHTVSAVEPGFVEVASGGRTVRLKLKKEEETQ